MHIFFIVESTDFVVNLFVGSACMDGMCEFMNSESLLIGVCAQHKKKELHLMFTCNNIAPIIDVYQFRIQHRPNNMCAKCNFHMNNSEKRVSWNLCRKPLNKSLIGQLMLMQSASVSVCVCVMAYRRAAPIWNFIHTPFYTIHPARLFSLSNIWQTTWLITEETPYFRVVCNGGEALFYVILCDDAKIVRIRSYNIARPIDCNFRVEHFFLCAIAFEFCVPFFRFISIE